MKKITIVGCGAYGLALATVLHPQNQVTVYTKFQEEKEEVEQNHRRDKVLKDVFLPPFQVTCSAEEAMQGADFVILAIPFVFLEQTFLEILPYLPAQTTIVIATKGLDVTTGKTAYELLKEQTALPIFVLSGPTFAQHLATFEPAILTVAAPSIEAYLTLKKCFPPSVFLEYTASPIAISYCGAVKNVFAILYGYLVGKNASATCKAAILYRSLQVFSSFLQKLGCSEESILTAAGVADFYMTAENRESRNHTFGIYLATKSQEEISNYLKNTTVEGVTTLKACLTLIEKQNIQGTIFRILEELVKGKVYSPQEILEALVE